MADGRYFKKSKNVHISTMDRPTGTKFGTVTQFNPLNRIGS